MLRLPPAFEPAVYRDRYTSLAGLKRSELREHWRQKGRAAGLNASSVQTRNQLLEHLVNSTNVLEIGPFDRPSLDFLTATGTNVDYADYLSTEQLVVRASEIPGRNPASVPFIRYILADGGYQQIDKQYDAVVSHHCLEHQPDLISHLLQIAKLLRPNGIYLCTVPDMRQCFDHYLAPSSLVDIITAYLEKRQKPSLHSILEHRCFTVHDWNNNSNPFHVLPANLRDSIDAAADEYSSSDYVDVHCWKFTANSFLGLVRRLISLEFLPPDTICRVYNLGGEFAVALGFTKESKDVFASER